MAKGLRAKDLKDGEALRKRRARKKRTKKSFEMMNSSDKDALLKELAVRAGLIDDSEGV